MQLSSTTLLIVVGITASSSTVYCEDSTEFINRNIREQWQTSNVVAATDCKKPQFVRRLYLDLAGRIPTPNEVQSFINDDGPDKDVVLVDQILQSEDYVQHFADVFDTLLMGRTQPNKYNERRKHQWRSWLDNVFRENRPWNDVVVEMLLARPNSEDDRGAVWFLYERNNDHQKMAESIAQAIFGIRIECAQCHDHMIATEIKQAHYWGLVAFFNRSTNQKTPSGPRVAESAIGGFSEFANLEGTSTPNLLTFFWHRRRRRSSSFNRQKNGRQERTLRPCQSGKGSTSPRIFATRTIRGTGRNEPPSGCSCVCESSFGHAVGSRHRASV